MSTSGVHNESYRANLPDNSSSFDQAYNIMAPMINFYHYGVSWMVPLILIVGGTGTSLCLIVLVKTKTTQPEIKCWFLALSITDLTTLAFGLSILYLSKLNYILGFYTANYDDFRNSSSVACYSVSILVYYSLLVSCWVQAGISVLRAISTRIPLQTRAHLSYRNARIGLAVTMLTALAISVIVVGGSTNYVAKSVRGISAGYRCLLAKQHLQVVFIASLVLKVGLPTLCLAISSGLIIDSLRKFNRTFGAEGGGGSQHGGSSLMVGKCSCNRRQTTRLQQRRISHLLLGMNVTFLLATLPFEVFKIVKMNTDRQSILSSNDALRSYISERIVDKGLNIFMYLNNATNWIFYFMLGKKFRQRVLRLVTLQPIFSCYVTTSPTSQERYMGPIIKSPARDSARCAGSLMALHSIQPPKGWEWQSKQTQFEQRMSPMVTS